MLATRMRMGNYGPLSYTLTDNAMSGNWSGDASRTTQTETVSIGTATSDRHVIVTIATPGSNSLTSLTLGGNSMTQAVLTFLSNDIAVYIYYLKVPSGTTASLVGVFAGATRGLAQVGIITGSSQLSVSDTQSINHTSETSLVRTPVVAHNEMCVLGCGHDQGNVTITWSGTGVTEEAEANGGGEIGTGTATLPDAGAAITAAFGGTRSIGLVSATFRGV